MGRRRPIKLDNYRKTSFRQIFKPEDKFLKDKLSLDGKIFVESLWLLVENHIYIQKVSPGLILVHRGGRTFSEEDLKEFRL